MWEAIKGILSSKKALMAFVSILVWVVAKAGLDLSTEQLLPIVGPLWLYIFGQGIADLGKEKAKVDYITAKTLARPESSADWGTTEPKDPS